MRLRAGLLMVLTVLGLVVAVSPAGPAWACSCAWDAAEQQRQAELIVVGRVTEVTDRWVRVVVESVEKGAADPAAPLRLSVSRNEASCGYEFREGSRYRVNSRAGETGLCIGVAALPPATSSASPAAAVPVAAPAVPAAAEPGRSFPWWMVGVGIIVVAVAGAAWRRRAR
ncbi:hypothetical protein AB0F81_03655 [Actinoplanes sp. NPDC024001]|uniref:hypothetical protein n=1 Tax=Actinoplanes sp. NPDC024001 TaxID=3154598 RepID=UPI0033D8232E